jgi:hypothetical protein
LSAGSRLQESGDSFPAAEVQEFAFRMVATNCFIERCSPGAWEEMEALETKKVNGLQQKTE